MAMKKLGVQNNSDGELFYSVLMLYIRVRKAADTQRRNDVTNSAVEHTEQVLHKSVSTG